MRKRTGGDVMINGDEAVLRFRFFFRAVHGT